MVGTTAALIGSVAAPLIGNVVGAVAGSGDKAKAQQAMNEALQQIQAVGAPPDLSAEIIRQKLQQVGVYTPKLEDAISQSASQVNQIHEDPSLKAAQTKALQVLQQRGAGGLNPEDRAAYNDLRRQNEKEAEGKRQQILQNMASRGMGGSGAELAAQLSAAQSGDENLSAGGDRLAAQASQNALQSMTQAGMLGGQIRAQDFDVNKTRAAAQDELNRFNTSQQIARQTRNVGAQNQAQQQNLSEQQRISDYNTAQANAEKLRQAEAKQQYWNNSLGYANSKAGALQGQAGNYAKNAQQTSDQYGKIGSGLGSAFGTLGDFASKQAAVPTAPQAVAAPVQKQPGLGVDTSVGLTDEELKKKYGRGY